MSEMSKNMSTPAEHRRFSWTIWTTVKKQTLCQAIAATRKKIISIATERGRRIGIGQSA
jgi:hypothetical protein